MWNLLLITIIFTLFTGTMSGNIAFASNTSNDELTPVFGPSKYQSNQQEYHENIHILNDQTYLVRIENGDGIELKKKKCRKMHWRKKWLCRVHNFITVLKKHFYKVRSADVYANDQKIISLSSSWAHTGTVEREVVLPANFQLKVKIVGLPWTYARLTILSDSVDNDPPVLTIHQPVENSTIEQFNIPIHGIANETLASIQANSKDLEVGPDGRSFSGEVHFSDEGIQTVSLMFSDVAGNIGFKTIQINVSVNQAPTAILSYIADPSIEHPFKVSFDGNQSSDPDSDQLTYFWEFGDGTTSTDPSPNHEYLNQGNYHVRLTVTDPGQLSDQAEVQVTIVDSIGPQIQLSSPTPMANFEINSVITISGISNEPLSEIKLGEQQLTLDSTKTNFLGDISFSTEGASLKATKIYRVSEKESLETASGLAF